MLSDVLIPIRETRELAEPVATIVIVLMMFGFPALAVVAIRYFKLKERELTLEIEYRERERLDIAERLQRLEDALASRDPDMRAPGESDESPALPASRPDSDVDIARAGIGSRERQK